MSEYVDTAIGSAIVTVVSYAGLLRRERQKATVGVTTEEVREFQLLNEGLCET